MYKIRYCSCDCPFTSGNLPPDILFSCSPLNAALLFVVMRKPVWARRYATNRPAGGQRILPLYISQQSCNLWGGGGVGDALSLLRLVPLIISLMAVFIFLE